MTADLVAFLTARWDETETEQAQDVVTRRLRGGWHNTDCSTYDYDPQPCDCGVPARVLADIQAKRAILTEHHQWHGPKGYGDPDGPMCAVCVSMVMDTARGGNQFRDTEHESWPCPTVRLLAVVYASHPDFNPAWTP